MSIYKSETYLNDCYHVIDKFDYFKELAGKKVLITGATGLICSSVADLLLLANEKYDFEIEVYVAGRNFEKVQKRFDKFSNNKYFHFVQYDATKEITFNDKFDYIIVGASNAYPLTITSEPIETMKDNFIGLDNLLAYASENKTKKVVYISSSEVYGKKDSIEPFVEDQYGYIDYLNPRSSYPVGKIAAETLCASYYQQENLSISIVRPGHIYGPTASRKDNRVSSMFAYDAADGKDLIMKSDGSQLRSYCYMLDCASALLCVMLYGADNNAYNISNRDSIMSIKEISERFAKYGQVNLIRTNATIQEQSAFNPMMNSSLNAKKLEILGWKGLFDKEEGTSHTITIIKEANL